MNLEFKPIKSKSIEWPRPEYDVTMTSEKSHFYCDGHKRWEEYTKESDPSAIDDKFFCKEAYLDLDQCPLCRHPKPDVFDWEISKPWDMEPQFSGEMCKQCFEDIFKSDF